MTKNSSLRLYLLCILMVLALVATALTMTQLFNKGEGIANAGTFSTIKVGSEIYTEGVPITFDYTGTTVISPSMVEANNKPVQSNYEYYYFEDDSAFANPIDNPVNAGDYVAKYKTATDASPDPDTEISILFTIKKATPNWVLQATGDDWLWQYAEDTTLSSKFHVEFGSLPDGNDDVVAAAITWRYSTDGGSSWADAEMNIEKSYPGQYWVKATVAATTNYNEYTTAYLPFEITKTRLYPVFNEITYNGDDQTVQIASLYAFAPYGDAKAVKAYQYSHIKSSYILVSTTTGTGSTITAKNAGDYNVTYGVNSQSGYETPTGVATGKNLRDLFCVVNSGVEDITATGSWTINKVGLNPTVTVANVTYGTAITEPAIDAGIAIADSDNGGWQYYDRIHNRVAAVKESMVVVNKYALKGNTTSSTELTDGDWTTTVPTNAGTYYVRSYLSNMDNYADSYNTTDATFTINKKAFYFMAQDNTITYGQAPAPSLGTQYNGFVNGDSFSNGAIDKSGLIYSFNYNQYDDVG